jgi:hypothetical protein
MIRITALVSFPAATQRHARGLHPLAEYQCCAAISHLQHTVQIPNCRLLQVAPVPNPAPTAGRKVLKLPDFQIWHGSCSVMSECFAREFE